MENVIRKMTAILFKPQCVTDDTWTWSHPGDIQYRDGITQGRFPHRNTVAKMSPVNWKHAID